MLPRFVAVTVACATWAELVCAQEFQVNTYTAGDQRAPSVASDANDAFVVAWQSGSAVRVQRFSSDATPLGNELSLLLGDQPTIGADAGGGFVIARRTGDYVSARRFDSNATPVGGDFVVNTSSTCGAFYYYNCSLPLLKSSPALARNGAGRFVVAWQSGSLPSGVQQVFGRAFQADGSPLGNEFPISEGPAPSQTPATAIDPAGNFIVAWQQSGGNPGVFGRRFAANASPQGGAFAVSSAGVRGHPSVATVASGSFLVVWHASDPGSPSDPDGVYARLYDGSGDPQTDEFLVNMQTTGAQINPVVAATGDGFTVVWQSADQDGSGQGVFRRELDAAGGFVGAEFQVNAFTTGDQDEPAVAANGAVIWTSGAQDGSGRGVFGRVDRGLVAQDVSVIEGHSGTSTAIVPVTLDVPRDEALTVHYLTTFGSAVAADFKTKAGQIVIGPGQTSGGIEVSVKGDTKSESDESFFVDVEASGGGSTLTSRAEVTILDDDPLPVLSIDDATLLEGGVGEKRKLSFRVRLSPASGQPAAVSWATEDGSASAPDSYLAASGSLLFGAGATSKNVTVTLKGNTIDEGDKTFTVQLTHPFGSGLADAEALGTILNDDAPPLPVVSVLNAAPVLEGEPASFVVTMAPTPTQSVSVKYATAAGSATQGPDFTRKTGTLTFQAGQGAKTVVVPTRSDALLEGPESFQLNLSAPNGCAVGVGTGQAIITNQP